MGFRYDLVNAVLGSGSDNIVDVVARAQAVSTVLDMPEFQAIAAACKRIRNILKQAADKKFDVAIRFAPSSGTAAEEQSLAEFLEKTGPRVEEQRQKKQYKEALLLLSKAREPVDRFFDKVMVMVEDHEIRASRLALLRDLLKEFSTIADFSEIVTEGKS
jgi:glycyl-tRNA synthetase beta chain